jgi:WD40 repeat protein
VVAVAGSAAWVWDVQTGRAVHPTLRTEGSTSSVGFSQDGAHVLVETAGFEVLSSSPRGKVMTSLTTASIVSAATGYPLGRIMKHATGARFSSDGKLVLAVELAGPAQAWDALSGAPVGKPFQVPGATDSVFSPDGRLLVGRLQGGGAQVWDFLSQRPVGSPLRPPGSLAHVRFSPDGRQILTVSADASARLWDGKAHRQRGGPIGHLSYLAFSHSGWSPDGRWILTAPSEGVLRLWDVDRGRPTGEPMLHPETLQGVIFSPDGARLLTISGAERTRVWDLRSGRSIGEPIPASATSLSRDGERVVTTTQDGAVQLWSASSGLRVAAAMGSDARSPVAAFSPGGERLVTGQGSKVQIWDVPVGRAEDAERLAFLAEAVGGSALTDLGTLIPTPDREARFVELRAERRPAAEDSVMARFLRWFLADRSTRTVSPLSRLSIPDFIRDCLGNKVQEVRDEARRNFRDHPSLPHPVQ